MEKMKHIGQVCWMFSLIILLGMMSISWIQKDKAYEVPAAVQLSSETSIQVDGAVSVSAEELSDPAWGTVSTERVTPAAKFFEKGTLYGLDAGGTVFLPTTSGLLYDLPLITGIKLPEHFTGDFSAVNGGEMVLKCIDYLYASAPQLLYQVSEVHFEPNVGIILYMLEDTKPILLGKTELIARIKKWQYSYERLADDYHQARYVDLRFDSQIVVKL